MKHRHKWKLEYTDGGMLGRGLLYHCECGRCLEYSKRTPRIKQLEEVIKILAQEKK